MIDYKVLDEKGWEYLREQLDREDFDGNFYPIDLLNAYWAGYKAGVQRNDPTELEV